MGDKAVDHEMELLFLDFSLLCLLVVVVVGFFPYCFFYFHVIL